MNRTHLLPNPPRGELHHGSRSPRPAPGLTVSSLSPGAARLSESVPRPPASAPPTPVRQSNAPHTSRAGPVDPPASDWSAPVHSRSPARELRSSANGAGRVYRSDTARASAHGLHTNHTVPAFLGVLSPPAEDSLGRRSLNSSLALPAAGHSPTVGTSTAGVATRLAIGSLQERLINHYTHRVTRDTLLDSSGSSDEESRREGNDNELGDLESPRNIVARVPLSGLIASSGEGSLGVLSASRGDGFKDEYDEFFSTFIGRLPLAWSRPLLRALTLQVATENVPARILTVTAVFDLYDDIKGELLGQLRVAEKEASAAAHAAQRLLSPSAGNEGPMGNGAEAAADAQPHVQAPRALRSATRQAGGPLQSPVSATFEDDTAMAPVTLDLYRMYSVAPSILRYRFNSLREAMYADMINQYAVAVQRQEEQEARGAVIPEENRIVMPSRQEVVNCLARPHPKDDLLFGACLIQGAPRAMEPGARLFRGAGGNEDVIVRSGSMATSPTASQRRGAEDSGDRTNVQGLGTGTNTLEPAFASVSFESMPSIFLKGATDLQLYMSRHPSTSLQSLGRGATRPRHAFFTREFLSTTACGGDASCLFATTFAPEFLVGLGAFIDHPGRAVRAAIRATLHRLNVLLGTELSRTLNPPSHIREHLRAPPLDLSVVYLRENELHVANTPGMESKLFFITNSLGSERLVLDLDDQYTASSLHGGQSSSRRYSTHLGDNAEASLSMASSQSSIASNFGAGTFEMPNLTRAVVDLSLLCTQVVSGPRHGGEGPHSANVALFYHSCRGGLSSSTVPMVPGDYHRTRRSRHHEGQSTTEPLLPLVVISATTEFWAVMPSRFASDLLRALVLLNEEAMLFPHGGLDAASAEKQLRGTQAWTDTMEAEYVARHARMEHVLQYIRNDLAEAFESGVRERLCEYFRHRVDHFRELDTRNLQTMPEKLREKLEQIAQGRQTQQQNGISEMSLPTTSTTTAPGMTESSVGPGLSAECAHTRGVCDAIAHALVVEAEALARQEEEDEEACSPEDTLPTNDEEEPADGASTMSATRLLLSDVTAHSPGPVSSNYSQPPRAGAGATGAGVRSGGAGGVMGARGASRHRMASGAPAQEDATHAHPFTLSVLIIPSAPISTRAATRRR